MKVFKSLTGFDKHRVDDPDATRRCLDTDEMQALGMSRNAEGQWITKVYEGGHR